MDGLLFDTETLYHEAIMAVATECGHEMTLVLFQRMLRGVWQNNRTLLLDHYGATFPVDAFRTAWIRHFDLIAETRLASKPGASELLDTLDELRLPKAIATSSSPHSVEHHLAAHKLTGRFDAIVAHGDYALNGIRSASSAAMMTLMVPDLLAPTDEIRALYR
jgi:beta-phosphoglucomutase-like phosphatase (HAD superfamily)